MRDINQLNKSEILQTPLNELKVSLSKEHKQKLKELFSSIRLYHPTWKPKIWFSDDWYSPDGVGGFTIPISLGHPKLIKIEKEYLGFCEGSSPKEFHQICCHETGHALDNAFKLRLNKRRQKLFGKTSKSYPSSYIPKVNKDQYIKFLGDFYAQAHPDEDWAETVGYTLYYGSQIKQKHSLAVKQKLALVNYILRKLSDKEPKKVHSKDLVPYTLPNMTFEQYLINKKRSLNLDKTSFYTPQIKKLKPKMPLVLDEKLLTEQITCITNENPWVIKKCIKELKKGCAQQGIPLKYKYQQNNHLFSNLIIENLSQFKEAGMTRVYM